ncbi:Protein unc-18 [Intoshia linei]|uniref:Protein unc-18 n=1 Tax=Intoshia linei TaxID=1819745 RepID=A0A177AXS5_9BILA|nr:Protein unc-18 [Intoshia linei]
MEFAHILQQKLDAYRADDHTMGTLPNKDKSQFLILDRGFDLITPLMHEISLQAFVNEFLPIKDSLFTYEVRNNNVPQKKEFLLNESDNLWVDYRHKPIYFYAKEINKLLKQFSDDKKLKSKKNTSVNDVSQMIKNMPQYQKEMNKYSAHLKIAEISLDKMHSLKNYILYQQNLATGYDVNESKINDPLRYVREMLSDQTLENFDKIKLILLTILSKETITKEVLDRICEHINLSEKEEKIILDFELLGVPIIKRDKNKKVLEHKNVLLKTISISLENSRLTRQTNIDVDKERVSILSQFYPNYTTKKPPMTFGVRKAKSYVENDMCRWVPNVKDIVEQAVNEKLDKRKFPILRNISRNFSSGQQAISVRYGQWHNKEQSQKSGLRLIIFIIGGVTFSEIRSIYEIINNNSNNFDIVIGSDMILQHNKIISSIMDLGSVQNN